jgi:hypothetical protein
MSYGIMGSARNSHILTYQTTRPAGCLYFDGESATLMGAGQMDSQMLFIYGNVTGPNVGDGRRFRGLEDEYNRASGLCQWAQDKSLGGPGWGVEGIVRMNAGFEMIWCNFTSSSARLVTRVNVTAPLLHTVVDDSTVVEITDGGPQTSPTYYPLPTETSPPGRSRDPDQPPMPPGWRRDELEPFLASQTWGWFESATWHYGSNGMGTGRGESRVRPLTCGFMTFYDLGFEQQQLARGDGEREKLNLTADGLWRGPGNDEDRKAALEQLMRRRRYHLLRNISDGDAVVMNTAAERVLRALNFDNLAGFRVDSSNGLNCTGIDWIAVSNDIVQRYAPRLQQLRTILDAGANIDMGNSTAVRRWFSGLRQHTHFLLMPYFEYPSAPINELASTRQLTLSHCKYQYTRLIAPDYRADTLTPEEALLTSAVEETLGSICTWVVDAGLAVEREWSHHFDGRIVHPPTFVELVDLWRIGLEELMAWLGWVDQWTYCKKGCAWDEVCYIPMWPMESVDGGGRGPGFGPGRGYGGRPYGRPYGRYFNEEEGPRRPSGPPMWFVNEDSLWEPKCIKAEYAI